MTIALTFQFMNGLVNLSSDKASTTKEKVIKTQASQWNGSMYVVNERFDFARPTVSTPAGAGAIPAHLASPLKYAVVAQLDRATAF